MTQRLITDLNMF